MKERPILFSGEMVRAILEGRKTQTRRVIDPDRYILPEEGLIEPLVFNMRAALVEVCRYGRPGDRLWVKETWGCTHKEYRVGYAPWYYADGEPPFSTGPLFLKRPSIFMPRWASRLTLEVVSVRVERVQEITEADAIAEGVQVTLGHMYRAFDDPGPMKPYTHRQAFGALWDEINGKRAPWASNPWVWVVTFNRVAL